MREYFKDRFTVDELAAMLDSVGLSPFDVLSTRSRPYQALDLANRQVNERDLLGLMVENPALIRRPLVVRDKTAVVGFDQSAFTKLVHGDSRHEEM